MQFIRYYTQCLGIKMQYLSKPLELSPQSESLSDDEIKEEKTMKAMELQADLKSRQSYKRLLDHYNINLKSNDDIYAYYESAITKSQSIHQSFKNIADLMMKEEKI